jgi:hypothetical protein
MNQPSNKKRKFINYNLKFTDFERQFTNNKPSHNDTKKWFEINFNTIINK